MSNKQLRVFATCHIGDAAENLLRERGYDLEIYPGPEAPPKNLIVEKIGLVLTGSSPHYAIPSMQKSLRRAKAR
jgi:hypothetical protein